MKVPLAWLAEWIDLPSLEALDERLTVGGLEIDEVIRQGPDLSGLIVGYVEAREQHPDADRLSVCRVAIGEDEPVEIVCGAPNVDAGQHVVVATHGTVLPDGTKIKRSKIRGVRSNGMICSARELGLGDDHTGILTLSGTPEVGGPADAALGGGDWVLDIAITPNRGDWLSMLGMAREVRAHFGGELRTPPLACDEAGESTSESITLAVDDGEGCPRYCARIVRGLTVGPSPDWMRERLEAAGVRSISNVVDVTNYVMLEWGQPLHAFDLAKLRDATIRVRRAKPGERLTTLDGEERALHEDDLVIADAERAIALAGVMGGAETEVGETTRDVLIEAALFHPGRVRKTARRHGLSTDASYRFERSVDPEGPARAATRAAQLLAELAGGEVAPDIAVATGVALPERASVRVAVARVNRLLGTALTAEAMTALLKRQDFEVREEADDLVCLAPSHRNDIALPVDLIEEIARIHGYDEIAPTLPAAVAAGVTEPPLRATTETVRDALRAAGLNEIMTFSAARRGDPDDLRLEADDPRRRIVSLENPIKAEEPVLRTTLVASALRAVEQNLARQLPGVGVFEVGRVFLETSPSELPEERTEAVAAIAGAWATNVWSNDAPLFFRLKSVVTRVLDDLGVAHRFRAGSDEPFLHPGVAAQFLAGRSAVAWLGELHPETAARFELEAPVVLAGFDLDALRAAPRPVPTVQEVSKFPSASRDFAVLLDAETQAGAVLDAARKAAGGLLTGAEVFDRYEGKGVPEGKVSLGLRLTFQKVDRTLKDAEVSKACERVVAALHEKFEGELR